MPTNLHNLDEIAQLQKWGLRDKMKQRVNSFIRPRVKHHSSAVQSHKQWDHYLFLSREGEIIMRSEIRSHTAWA